MVCEDTKEFLETKMNETYFLLIKGKKSKQFCKKVLILLLYPVCIDVFPS